IEASALVAAEKGQGAQLRDSVVAAPRMHADDDVLDRGQILEQADVLERSGDAQPRDPVGGQSGDLVRLHPRSAGLEWDVSGDDVHERRLARASGPDESLDRSLPDLQRPPVDGAHPAEVTLEVSQSKEHAFGVVATTAA